MIVVDYPRYATKTHHDHGRHGRFDGGRFVSIRFRRAPGSAAG
jgi:hypothetical protein